MLDATAPLFTAAIVRISVGRIGAEIANRLSDRRRERGRVVLVRTTRYGPTGGPWR